MTLGNLIAWDDTTLPFQLDSCDVRGRVVHLDGVIDSVLSQHNYQPEIEALVAEAALLTALIGQSIKRRWKLSLQIRGDGPARLISTDYYTPKKEGDPAMVRANASYDEDRLDAEGTPFDRIGKGFLAVLIDQGDGKTPYSGSSLSDCAQVHFAQPEQLPTRFHLTFGRSTWVVGEESWRAGGVMLQHMPKASPHVTGEGGSGAEGGASHLKNHPGQIAFPGGRVDPEDVDAKSAALREAWEEIGLPQENVSVFFQLPAHETVTSYSVTPILGLMTRPFTERLKVEEVFSVSFKHISNPTIFFTQGRCWQGATRYYETVPFGPYYIWGTTAHILRILAERLSVG